MANTHDMHGYTWIGRDGNSMQAPSQIVCGEALKHIDAADRQVYRVTVDGHETAMKVRRWRGLKRMWRATKNSPVAHEWEMLLATEKAGLVTPKPLALGERRCFGLVKEEALLMEYFEGCTRLRDIALNAAESNDAATLDTVEQAMIDRLGAIRHAGFADDDFGAHNLITPVSDDTLSQPPMWIDLETAFAAEPDDPDATIRSVRITFTGWWTATGGDQKRLQGLFERTVAMLPEPSGGWSRSIDALNASMLRRVQKAIRLDRIDRPPEPLVLP